MAPLVHPVLGEIVVQEVPEELTLDLRQQVLRPHQRADELRMGAAPGAVTFGALTVAGEVVGTAWVAPEPAPPLMQPVMRAARVLHMDGSQWRLRCMATRPDARRSGVGEALVGAVMGHVGAGGGGLLWCNVRLGAVAFYSAQGFETFGEPWDEDKIGPHVVMWRLVDQAQPA